MAKNGETKVIDKGFNTVMSELTKTDGSTVDVGILKTVSDFIGPQQPSSALDVAGIAAVQEFGTDKAGASKNIVIPERPFLRSTFDEKKTIYRLVLKSLMGDVLIGDKTIEQALSLFGERVVGDIKRKITDIRDPSNAPSTIQQKGFDNPLISTGTLRSRIKKRVNL